jgi:hypothetical protein
MLRPLFDKFFPLARYFPDKRGRTSYSGIFPMSARKVVALKEPLAVIFSITADFHNYFSGVVG